MYMASFPSLSSVRDLVTSVFHYRNLQDSVIYVGSTAYRATSLAASTLRLQNEGASLRFTHGGYLDDRTVEKIGGVESSCYVTINKYKLAYRATDGNYYCIQSLPSTASFVLVRTEGNLMLGEFRKDSLDAPIKAWLVSPNLQRLEIQGVEEVCYFADPGCPVSPPQNLIKDLEDVTFSYLALMDKQIAKKPLSLNEKAKVSYVEWMYPCYQRVKAAKLNECIKTFSDTSCVVDYSKEKKCGIEGDHLLMRCPADGAMYQIKYILAGTKEAHSIKNALSLRHFEVREGWDCIHVVAHLNKGESMAWILRYPLTVVEGALWAELVQEDGVILL